MYAKIMFLSVALMASGMAMAQDHVGHGHDSGAHEYTDVHPLVAAIPEVIPLHSYPDFVRIKAAGAELRTWPSDKEGRVIRKLGSNDEVAVIECPDSTQDTVDGTRGKWCIVEHDEARGFVFNKYLP